MPKYLLSFLLLIFLNPEISKAQGIGQVRIQYANPGMNNNLHVIAQVTVPSQPAYRISNSSRVSNDTLYLEACYYSGIQGAPKQLTDTIAIGSPPQGIHTLRFKIFTSLSTSQCTETGSAVKFQAFAISAPLGIKSTTDKPEIAFYPNPVRDFLKINNKDIQSIIIRDLTGKIIKNYHFQNEAAIQLDVRSLETGIYLVETISNGGQILTGRLLKD